MYVSSSSLASTPRRRRSILATLSFEHQTSDEVEKFRRWDLDIIPHRRLITEGMDLPAAMRGKPLEAHSLMQAIARANRVNEGKNNGLIVDYCGVLKHLRKALATFAGSQGEGGGNEGSDAGCRPRRHPRLSPER